MEVFDLELPGGINRLRRVGEIDECCRLEAVSRDRRRMGIHPPDCGWTQRVSDGSADAVHLASRTLCKNEIRMTVNRKTPTILR